MLGLLVSFLCVLVIVSGGDQPWPLKLDEISSCCQYVDDSSSLYSCVRETSGMDSPSFPKSSKVAILSSAVTSFGSHAMNDLQNFTQYQLTLVAAYAEQNGYAYISLDDPEDASHEPEDIRWNKIKLLIDALDPTNGWARSTDYIVWIGKWI